MAMKGEQAMAKRQTIESRVLEYFRTAPQAEMELVYGLVQGEVKQRRAAGMQPARVQVPRRKRRKPEVVTPSVEVAS